MEEKSLVQTLLDDKNAQSKRKDIIIILLIIVYVITVLSLVGGFLWYINQFDYHTENTATFETDNNGNISTGDINNG